MFKSHKLLPYNINFLYEIIADVEQYPQFIPWLSKVQVITKLDNIIMAQLEINYKQLRSNYISEVTFDKYTITTIAQPNDWLNSLECRWQLHVYNESSTLLNFDLQVEFKSKLIAISFGKIFKQLSISMIEAFNQRAQSLSATSN